MKSERHFPSKGDDVFEGTGQTMADLCVFGTSRSVNRLKSCTEPMQPGTWQGGNRPLSSFQSTISGLQGSKNDSFGQNHATIIKRLSSGYGTYTESVSWAKSNPNS